MINDHLVASCRVTVQSQRGSVDLGSVWATLDPYKDSILIRFRSIQLDASL